VPDGEDPFAALPHEVALIIFSRLTVEQRLRCIAVCRGWRATLADRDAWLQLDLTRADGSDCSEALLLAATSRAGGQLRSLRLACGGHALHDSLCAVAAGNVATLEELRISAPGAAYPQRRRVEELEALLRAAPQLRTLEADVNCDNAAEAQRVLRNEPPFGPLRVRQLNLSEDSTLESVLAVAADLATHASLESFRLQVVPLDVPAALDAVVDAALVRRVSSLGLRDCCLSPDSAPALARLLGGNALTQLNIIGGIRQLLDAPAAALLANALRANTSLTALALAQIELWHDAAAATQLMDVLTVHPRLRKLDLSWNQPDDDGLPAEEVGAALATLLLANAPALQTLDISWCILAEAGLAPVVGALRHNTHLTQLNCSANGMSEWFARKQLLPAVRANASLRKLIAADTYEEVAACEVEAEVAARTHPA
jgi:hypothetical protein